MIKEFPVKFDSTWQYYCDGLMHHFAVHPDFKSHMGGAATGANKEGGAILATSRKQKLNTHSSTESELAGADDLMTMILWTKLFLEAQGYLTDNNNNIHQDNRSAILLKTNGRASTEQSISGICYFIKDQVAHDNVVIQYCPTNQMMGDFFTKPLQGLKFTNWRDIAMNSWFADPDLDLVGSAMQPHHD